MNIYIYEIENDGDQIEIDLIGTDKQQLGQLTLKPNQRKRVVWNVIETDDLNIQMYKMILTDESYKLVNQNPKQRHYDKNQ